MLIPEVFRACHTLPAVLCVCFGDSDPGWSWQVSQHLISQWHRTPLGRKAAQTTTKKNQPNKPTLLDVGARISDGLRISGFGVD